MRILAPRVSLILKKALVVLLLGWLPLQATAFPVLTLKCGQDAGGMHGDVAHDQHAHHGSPSGHAGDDAQDGSSPGPLYNCCHNLPSAALPAAVVPAGRPVVGVEPTLLFHLYFFYPDQPKRPPLTGLV